MAGSIMNYEQTSNFVCDTEDEIQNLPTTTEAGTGVLGWHDKPARIGSICIVGNESGDLLVYMLFSFGWKQL